MAKQLRLLSFFLIFLATTALAEEAVEPATPEALPESTIEASEDDDNKVADTAQPQVVEPETATTEELVVEDLSDYKTSGPTPEKTQTLDNLNKPLVIRLLNKTDDKKNNLLGVDMQCSQPVAIVRQKLPNLASVEVVHLEVYRPKKNKAPRVVEIVFPKTPITCDLSFQNKTDKAGYYGLRLVSK